MCNICIDQYTVAKYIPNEFRGELYLQWYMLCSYVINFVGGRNKWNDFYDINV